MHKFSIKRNLQCIDEIESVCSNPKLATADLIVRQIIGKFMGHSIILSLLSVRASTAHRNYKHSGERARAVVLL